MLPVSTTLLLFSLRLQPQRYSKTVPNFYHTCRARKQPGGLGARRRSNNYLVRWPIMALQASSASAVLKGEPPILTAPVF